MAQRKAAFNYITMTNSYDDAIDKNILNRPREMLCSTKEGEKCMSEMFLGHDPVESHEYNEIFEMMRICRWECSLNL